MTSDKAPAPGDDTADMQKDLAVHRSSGADDEKGPRQENNNVDAGREEADDYSVFTTAQKRAIVLTASFASFFSPMTGSIYVRVIAIKLIYSLMLKQFPALTVIANDLHVSASQINITVTTYLIVQGLAPMMIAGFSDRAGRRPAYLVCFVIYIIANLALSLQNSYPALLGLRMLQAAGSSGTVALANGVVGDVVTSSQRGEYIAWASLGGILGPSLSPVIGGLLSQYLDWHWIFWFLLILSSAFTVPFFLFMPETCRNLVGNASIPPPWPSMNLADYWRFRHRAKQGIKVDPEKLKELRKNFKIVIPNPLDTIKVLFSLQMALLLVPTGLLFALYYALLTGASDVFQKVYGYDQLVVGLIFLSIGGGSIISAFTTGKLIDWNYRRHAIRLGYPVRKNKNTDLTEFPIEKARLEMALPLIITTGILVIGYGWMMIHKISLAGPVILLFLIGYTLIAGSQTLSVVLVDIYPGRPAAATAANNITRCLLGAAASAALTPMSEVMGYGWAYTVLSLLALLTVPGLFYFVSHGIQLRKRAKKIEAHKTEIQASGQKST